MLLFFFDKTWKKEAAVMACLLFIGAIISHYVFLVGLFEVTVTFVAVMSTFCHAQVSDRLREYADGGVKAPPECSYLEQIYYYVKEISWLLLFIYLANLPALIGTAGFIVYPMWRSYWRKSQCSTSSLGNRGEI